MVGRIDQIVIGTTRAGHIRGSAIASLRLWNINLANGPVLELEVARTVHLTRRFEPI